MSPFKPLVFLSVVAITACGHKPPRAAISAAAPHVVMVSTDVDPQSIRNAIGRALSSTGFVVENEQPGQVVASHRAGARVAQIAVVYEPGRVTFRYMSSQNMESGVDENGQPLLDRHYGSLMSSLDSAVQREIAAGAAPPPAAPMDLEQVIAQQAGSTAPGATRLGNVFIGAGDRGEWAVAIPPGTCFWTIGAGEQNKIGRLELYIWDPHNRRITESHNDANIAIAGTCVGEGGMYKFQAKVQSGSGAYKVAVYARPQ